MLIRCGYRYELRLNNKERDLLQKCAGTARFAWNWGLAELKERYQTHTGNERYTDAMKQHKLLNSLKATVYPWLYKYSKCIPQEALRDLHKAVTKFLEDRKQGRKTGFPRFKKKGKCRESFRLTGSIKLGDDHKRVQLPRLGRLRLKEAVNVPENARILSATVSCEADHWFVALTVAEERELSPPVSLELQGLDAGLKRFLTMSNGTDGFVVPKPRFLLRQLRKLRRLSRQLSRRTPGSKNWLRAKQQLVRFHYRVKNQRQDFLHKLSHFFATHYGILMVEELAIQNLMKNHKQAKYWQDLSYSTFKLFLNYKTLWYGSHMLTVPRWYPSSKLCSNCNWYNAAFTIHDPIFHCELCGLSPDRDVNASRNLDNYYYFHYYWQFQPVAASSAETLNACGERVRPVNAGNAPGSTKEAPSSSHHPPSRALE